MCWELCWFDLHFFWSKRDACQSGGNFFEVRVVGVHAGARVEDRMFSGASYDHDSEQARG